MDSKTVFNLQITDENRPMLLEQYKLYLEAANLTTQQRSQANTFFLTINTILISAITGLLELSTLNSAPYWIVFACISGILLCISWYFLLRSYRNLNSGRFTLIQEIEKELPARIYAREWEIVLNRRGKRYIRQTFIEQFTPIVFSLLFIAILVSMAIL